MTRIFKLQENTKELWDKFIEIEKQVAGLKGLVQNYNQEIPYEQLSAWVDYAFTLPPKLSDLVIKTAETFFANEVVDK